MTSPVAVQEDTGAAAAVSQTAPDRPISERIVRAGIGQLTKLARSPSSGSLNSVLSLANDPTGSTNTAGEQGFRVCRHCATLLDTRERQKARQFEKPIVCQFYEKMRGYMEEASRLAKIYNKMWESFREGESTYELEDGQALRSKIAKLAESIDSISKKISVLGIKSAENPPPPAQQARLHEMVRAAAIIFLKDELLLTVQALPTPDEYAKSQLERQRRIEARIAYEAQLEEKEREKTVREQRRREGGGAGGGAAAAPSQNERQNRQQQQQSRMILDQSQGWGASSITPVLDSSMEPIIEQMINLQAYIKQAKADCKYEEVATLETNLRELGEEYDAMIQTNNNTESSAGVAAP